MTLALIYGASSGALHAVTGPDHLLSLGPVALHEPKRSWRIGLFWGIGHALGTLALALPVLLLSELVELSAWAAVGNRLAGAALLGTAAWSWWSLRRARSGDHHADSRNPLWVGLIHGATGASALLLVLPVLVSGSVTRTVSFLAAFAAGSTLAMAALTWVIARAGAGLGHRTVARIQSTLTLSSLALGLAWLVLG